MLACVLNCFSHVWLFATLWTVACQAPFLWDSPGRKLEWLTIIYSRDLPDPGIKPMSPALAGGFFTTEPPGKPHFIYICILNFDFFPSSFWFCLFWFYMFFLTVSANFLALATLLILLNYVSISDHFPDVWEPKHRLPFIYTPWVFLNKPIDIRPLKFYCNFLIPYKDQYCHSFNFSRSALTHAKLKLLLLLLYTSF